MKKIFILSLVLFLWSFTHPFYLSVTELKYQPSEKMIQGSVKIFVNDLEDALQKIHNQKVDLINVKDSAVTNLLIAEYLKKRLIIFIDNKKLEYQVLGFEHEMEAVWIYFEGKSADPKKLKVENTILYDFIKDQTNIVHVEINEVKKSSKVSFPEKLVQFEF